MLLRERVSTNVMPFKTINKSINKGTENILKAFLCKQFLIMNLPIPI